MSLITFTDKHNNGRPVHVAAQHIVSVQTIGDDTWVSVTATLDGGKSRAFVVQEDEAIVVQAINQRLSRS